MAETRTLDDRHAELGQALVDTVFDVSENRHLTDEDAVFHIAKALKARRYPYARMIGHGRQLITVWPEK